jgi:hypothetical protein
VAGQEEDICADGEIWSALGYGGTGRRRPACVTPGARRRCDEIPIRRFYPAKRSREFSESVQNEWVVAEYMRSGADTAVIAELTALRQQMQHLAARVDQMAAQVQQVAERIEQLGQRIQ